MDYADALAWLYARQRFGIKLGLETIQRLLERLDHPEATFRAFHVGGTNGKGSTSALLESALRHAGHRVGLFLSPHLVSFRERIQVGGEPIAPEDVARGVERLRPIVEDLERGGHPATFFECATALAFDHFRAQRVPLAVVEVGLGGRLDATNVLQPVATMLTNVGLDHTQQLGPSIQSIAREKAGIFRRDVPAFTAARREALDTLAREATNVGVPLRVVRRPDAVEETLDGTTFRTKYLGTVSDFRLRLLGEHQAENAALALAALEAAQREAPVDAKAAQAGFLEATSPGRLEIVARDPLVLLDGAHNAPAAEALAGFLGRRFPDGGVACLLGVLRDKAATRITAALAPHVSRFVLTQPPTPRALPVSELAHAMPRDAPEPVLAPEPAQALRALLTEGDEPVRLVTGSLFLVGEARANLLRLERDPGPATPLLQ